MGTHRVIAASLLLASAVVACGDDGATTTAAPATTTTATPTTTAVAATTTLPATTTVPTTATTTTTTPPTTTTVPFSGDTTTKTNTTVTGSPGALVDVRIGRHEGFTRIVFDFDGDGVPYYVVGYVTPPIYGEGSGEPYDVAGSHVIGVNVQPASAFWVEQTYFGPLTITPSLGSVVEISYLEDFEASLQYAIGVDGMKAFNVFTLQGPQRLVIDIAD